MDEYRVENDIVEKVDASEEAAYADICSAMKLGIIACALAEWPGASIAAIVLGANAKKKVATATEFYTSRGLEGPKRRLPARILALVGFFAGIGCTVFWTLYFLALCTCACGMMSYNNLYY